MTNKLIFSLIACQLMIFSANVSSADYSLEPREDKLKEFTFDIPDDFKTMEKVEKEEDLDDLRALFPRGSIGGFLRLKSTTELGKGVFVVDQYNHREEDERKIPTVIVVAGKPDLEDSFGATQNGAVTIETREGFKDELDKEVGFLGRFRRSFTKELTNVRNAIFNKMKKDDMYSFGKDDLNNLLNKTSEVKNFISNFVANASDRTFNYDKASLVITQLWKEGKRPYNNDNNLGIMYVVAPEESETIDNAQIWKNLIYDTAQNIILNALNIIAEQRPPALAVQIHLPGGGKFLFSGVSQNEANAIFTQGLIDKLREIVKSRDVRTAGLRRKLHLHFAFTPYYQPEASPTAKKPEVEKVESIQIPSEDVPEVSLPKKPAEETEETAETPEETTSGEMED